MPQTTFRPYPKLEGGQRSHSQDRLGLLIQQKTIMEKKKINFGKSQEFIILKNFFDFTSKSKIT